jgi:hypothetical protein
MRIATRRLVASVIAGLTALGAGALTISKGLGPLTRQGPVLEVKPDQVTVRTRSGKSERVSFVLGNLGDAPLMVQRIEPLCQCTLVSKPTEPIAPGASWRLELDVRPPGVGTRSSGVIVHSNCRAAPTQRLLVTMEREVEPPYVFNAPALVDFADGSQIGDSQQVLLKAVERGDQTPWLARSRLDDLPFAQLESVGFSEGSYGGGYVERAYEFRVRLAESIPEGTHTGSITLLSESQDGATTEAYAVRVRARHNPLVRFAPSKLYFRPETNGQTPPCNVLIVTERSRLVVESVQPSGSWIQATVISDATAGSRLQRLQVRIIDTPQTGPRQATLVVRTTEPERKEWTLPIYVAAKG